MPDIVHNTLVGTELHDSYHYVQSADPGAVGSGKNWLDTTTTPFQPKRRDAGNAAWVLVGNAAGGGGVTVQDEGSALATTATTLNFTGAGVTASGTGAVKTVSIPGAGAAGGLGNYYDVKQTPYFATGNGVTDDRAVINQAITDAAAAGGGVVYLPTGNYRITGPLLLRSNVTVRGVGHTARLVLANGVLASGIIAQVAGINNWRVEHLQIDGNKANNAPGANFLNGFGITLNNVGGGTVSDCYIHDTVNGAVYIDGGLCTVEYCIVENIGRRGTDPAASDQIVGRSGIVFEPFNAAVKSGNRMMYNQLLNVMEHGLKFYNSNEDGLCIGNRIINNATDGDNSAFSIYIEGVDRARVIGNYIQDTTNTHYECAIDIEGALYPLVGCTVADNIVLGSRVSGILVNAGHENSVTGNVVRNTAGNGVWILNANRNAVVGNQTTGSGGGVVVAGGTGNVVTGNV